MAKGATSAYNGQLGEQKYDELVLTSEKLALRMNCSQQRCCLPLYYWTSLTITSDVGLIVAVFILACSDTPELTRGPLRSVDLAFMI